MINFINSKTDKYSEYKLKCVTVDGNAMSIVIEFVYPSSISITEELSKKNTENELKAYAEEFFGLNGWNISVKLIRSYYNDYSLKEFTAGLLGKYPAVSSVIKEGDIVVENRKEIYLNCDDRIYDYILSAGIGQHINNRLNANFCDEPVFKPRLRHKLSREELDTALESDIKAPEMTDVELRRISVTDRESFIGDIITLDAVYIKDVITEGETIICGKISGKREFRTKEKDKPFFKFVLTDPTGNINVLFFPNKNNYEKAAQMEDGDTLILTGTVKAEKYKDKSSYTVSAKNMTYCRIPAGFKEVIHEKEAPRTYSLVKPVPFIAESKQMTLTDYKEEKKINPCLVNKTFVVFDLETTGVDILVDKVIEICGIKIVNGKLTELFSTFVDPETPIPEEITKLTGINDVMVAGKPKIHEIIPDFYKFCNGAELVAHNAPFDIGFIRRFAGPMDYNFKNNIIDTLPLARKFLKLNKYKLENLAEYYGYKNKGAHRAIYDTEVLCYIFINLSEYLDKFENLLA